MKAETFRKLPKNYEMKNTRVVNSEYKHKDKLTKMKSKKVIQELTEMGVLR